MYDHKESISNTPDPTGVIGGFSDESLMRVLINKYSPDKVGIKEIDRGVDVRKEWIDRSWWGIDIGKLRSDGYVCCNFLRPFSAYYQYCEPIVKYIWADDNIKKENVIL